jgi:hypothetical protein
VWYIQQTECFENLVLPLIDLVERVLPPSSCNLRKRAENNMQLWKEGGREWLEAYRLPSASIEDVLGKTELSSQRMASRTSSDLRLASQIREQRAECVSKAVKRYEKNMEAACNTLIAVTWSGDEETDPIDQDNNNLCKEKKIFWNDALNIAACTLGRELPLGGAAPLKLSITGEEYLKVDGSMHGGLGWVLTSISTQDDVTVNGIKDTWSTIVLITKDSQSQEIHDRLDTIIAYCLKFGLLVQV